MSSTVDLHLSVFRPRMSPFPPRYHHSVRQVSPFGALMSPFDLANVTLSGIGGSSNVVLLFPKRHHANDIILRCQLKPFSAPISRAGRFERRHRDSRDCL